MQGNIWDFGALFIFFCLDKFWEGIGFFIGSQIYFQIWRQKSLRMLNLLNTF
jgi:hypothetical protein